MKKESYMNQMESLSVVIISHFCHSNRSHKLALQYLVNELKVSALILSFVTSPHPLPQLTTGFLATLLELACDPPTLALTEALAAICEQL